MRPVVALFARPLLWVSPGMISCPVLLLPWGQVPVIFWIARDCGADYTAALVG
jgi:hypothetical protein